MKLRWLLVCGIGLACLLGMPKLSVADGAQGVGAFSRVQNAKVRAASSSDFRNVSKGQAVNTRDLVRTGRRSYAEITFADQTLLRINEFTDLVIQPSEMLRKMQLDKGAIWMRVTKGSGTSIQTPVATATVRGTEFSFDSFGNLWVFEGTVWLEAGGETLEVNAGEGAEIGPDGKPRKRRSQEFQFQPEMITHTLPDQPANTEPWWNPDDWHVKDTKIEYAALLIPFLIIGGGDTPHHDQGVPEPATCAAIALGFVALNLRRRRKPSN